MKAWKRNLVIAAVMVFVCAGVYLNWLQEHGTPSLSETLDADVVLGESTLVMAETEAETAAAASLDAALEQTAELSAEERFAVLRLSRQQARDSAVELLQEAMAYDDAAAVGQASGQLTGLVASALQEAQIESLVMAKGYEDCVTYLEENTVFVAVAAPAEGLQQADVAVISDIVTSQTEYDLTQLRIIEVN